MIDKLRVFLLGLVASFCLLGEEVRPELTFPFQGSLTGDQVAVHSRATVNSESLDYLRKGVKLTVYGERGEWYRIGLPHDVPLWIESNALSADGSLIRNAVLYAGPSSIFKDLGILKSGERVVRHKEGEQDGFVAIESPSQARAWIYRRYVKPLYPVAVTKAVSDSSSGSKASEKVALERKLATETARLAADKKKLAGMESKAADLRRERAQMEMSLTELQAETARLERQREEASLKALQLRAELKEQSSRVREDLRRLEAESQKAAADRAAAQGENAQLAAAARAKALEVEAAKAELARLEKLALAEKARVEAEATAQRLALEAAKERLSTAEKSQLAIVARQAQLGKSIKELEGARAAAEKYLVALRGERDRLETAKKTEEASVASLKSTVEKLAQEKSRMRAQAEASQRELELLTEAARAEAERVKAAQLRSSLEAKAAEAKASADLRAAQGAADQAIAEAKAAQAALEAVRQEVKSAEEAREAAALEVKKAREARERFEAERKQEAEKLARAKEAEAARLASMEPEVLPVELLFGVVKPLRGGGNQFATHALCQVRNQRLVVLCYLSSPGMSLDSWVDYEVSVEGEKQVISGWRYPLLRVSSIMRKR